MLDCQFNHFTDRVRMVALTLTQIHFTTIKIEDRLSLSLSLSRSPCLCNEDKSEVYVIIFVDLEKASRLVDHSILLKKLGYNLQN